jgi:hypothetical protein
MEFYKEGKVIRVTDGQTLDLSSATYNHKAFHIIENTINSGATCGAWFYTKGILSSKVVLTLLQQGSILSPTLFTDDLYQMRLAKIENFSGITINLVLFN